jgi:hypothetical protein
MRQEGCSPKYRSAYRVRALQMGVEGMRKSRVPRTMHQTEEGISVSFVHILNHLSCVCIHLLSNSVRAGRPGSTGGVAHCVVKGRVASETLKPSPLRYPWQGSRNWSSRRLTLWAMPLGDLQDGATCNAQKDACVCGSIVAKTHGLFPATSGGGCCT